MASAAVKAHMFALLQEASKVSAMPIPTEDESSTNARKLHMEKVAIIAIIFFIILYIRFRECIVWLYLPNTVLSLTA